MGKGKSASKQPAGGENTSKKAAKHVAYGSLKGEVDDLDLDLLEFDSGTSVKSPQSVKKTRHVYCLWRECFWWGPG
jgi:hypothetical protein